MESRTWRARPFLSRLLRLCIFVVPIVVSVCVAYVAARLLPHPSTVVGAVLWWVVFVAALSLPAALCIRIGRRLLPIAALLKITLVFPDKAPSRFEVAKRAGRTRDLRRRLAEQGEDVDATEAATLVLALITSLGEHDRLTRGHSERVRAFTDMLAEQIELPRMDREKLRWAALLHDIGKLEVDTEILNKPGRPSEDEWSVLQRHPLGGIGLLGPLKEWLDPWSAAVSDHHERWDGTGYPRGLASTEISLGGRILAITDSYEVMTAARPYKTPMTAEAARRELTKCAGSHFDPRLVREFLEVSVGRLWIGIGLGALVAQLPVISGLSYRGLTQRFGRSLATAAGAVGATAALAVGGAIEVPGVPSEGPVFIATTGGQTAMPGSQNPRPEGGRSERPSDDAEVPENGEGGGADQTPGEKPIADPRPAPVDPSRPGEERDPPEGRKPQVVVKQGDVVAAAVLDPTVPGLTETEFLSSCATPGSQGADAWVFRVPESREVSSLQLQIESAAGGDDAHVRTYTESCDPIGARWIVRRASVSPDTTWVVVVPTRGLATSVSLAMTLR